MMRLDKAAALAALAHERSAGCRMCELTRELEPIASSEHAIAILDRYASRPGHVLVVSRRHEERVAARLVWDMCGAIDRALAPRRTYVAALGAAAALDTSFPHVHIHLVPLTDGGELDRPANVFTWVHGVHVFESAAEERVA